ncbi:alpha/beta fold hydrolase [Jidongwangia harbinensis]|uniref:alpha/beta fold hydrolase n=1 Tax=Jidongwangia harbinensis TaxID=2878561 RepID=UPI001CD9B8C5|nr:alpha/beta hydrolase [Jidongwangia harbinensis]MCA2214014.1 alpha/beta hydrolase [Jidongwangia harbinensis]
METVTSQDGTPIAYQLAGSGRPLVFVTGAFNDHTRCAPLAAALAGTATVVTYDRRARGGSGDTRPYRIDLEVADLAAVIDRAGGPAAVFGYSSGAVLALRAAAAGLPITRLVLFEAPFAFDGPARAADLPDRLQALIDAGRPGDAVTLFQTEGIGLPAEFAAQIRRSPIWPALEAMAQSTVYDATLTTELAVPTPDMAAAATPTLVVNGAGTWPGLASAARTLATLLPQARHREVPAGADHDIPVEATAAVVREFLADG